MLARMPSALPLLWALLKGEGPGAAQEQGPVQEQAACQAATPCRRCTRSLSEPWYTRSLSEPYNNTSRYLSGHVEPAGLPRGVASDERGAVAGHEAGLRWGSSSSTSTRAPAAAALAQAWGG